MVHCFYGLAEMKPLPEELSDCVRIAWHMTSWCNYRCEYCGVLVFKRKPGSAARAPHAFDHYPVETWVHALRWRFSQRSIYFKITGGEPFLDRENFRALLGGLTEDPRFLIRVDTNGSWEPGFFRSVANPRILLNVSYHPSEIPLPAFVRRLASIRQAGFQITMVNLVLAPESLSAAETAIRVVDKEGFFISVSAMIPAGAYADRQEREAHELKLIERYNTPLDDHFRVHNPSTLGRPCFHPALSYYLSYDGSIAVDCLGVRTNLFAEGPPERPPGAVACPHRHCQGCVEMYRSLADEPLVAFPLSLCTLDEYVEEVRAWRRKWRIAQVAQRVSHWFARRRGRQEERAGLKREATIQGDVGREQRPAGKIVGYLDWVDGKPLVKARSGERIVVGGWAASLTEGAPVKEIHVLVDGEPLSVIRHFHDRPDVAAAHNRSDFLRSGWRAMPHLPALSPGRHRLWARAVSNRGLCSELPALVVEIVE